MHILNLGVMQTTAAEGLLWLTEHSVHGGVDVADKLRRSYGAFKEWLKTSGLACSQRCFTPANLHLNNPDYPFLSAKAFNCRVVLAWLADPWLCFKPPGTEVYTSCCSIYILPNLMRTLA